MKDKMMTQPNVMPVGQWHGAFSSLNDSQKNQQEILHTLAWQALKHAELHGDTSLLVRMLNEQPNTSRVDTLARWAKTFAPIIVHVKKENGTPVLGEYGRPLVVAKLKKEKVWQLDDAWALPFFNMEKPKADGAFNFPSLTDIVRQYISRADRVTSKGGLTPEQLEKVSGEKAAAVAMLVSMQATV